MAWRPSGYSSRFFRLAGLKYCIGVRGYMAGHGGGMVVLRQYVAKIS